MNKSFLVNFSFGLVLISGLVSCNRENTGPSSSSDNFDLAQPVLHAEFKPSDAGYRLSAESMGLDAKLPQAAYLTSSIEMPSLKNHNFDNDPISLNAVSTCQGPNTSAQVFAKQLTNASSFQFLNLIDPVYVLQFSLGGQNINCSFNLEFKNKFGSTVNFEYKDVVVAPLANDDMSEVILDPRDAQGKAIANQVTILREVRNSADVFPVIAQTRFGYFTQPNDKISLVCENYVSQFVASNRAELTLAQFDNAPLIWQKDVSAFYPGADPRVLRPSENCRVMLESDGADKTIKFSRQFGLVQEITRLQINSYMNINLFDELTPDSSFAPNKTSDFLTIDIFNPTDYPTTLAIGNLTADLVQTKDRTKMSFQHNPYPTVLSTEGGQYILQDPNYGKIMNLSAHSHIIVKYQVQFPEGCTFVGDRRATDPSFDPYQALYVGLKNNVQIYQVDNPVLEGMSFQASIEESISTNFVPGTGWTTKSLPDRRCGNF